MDLSISFSVIFLFPTNDPKILVAEKLPCYVRSSGGISNFNSKRFFPFYKFLSHLFERKKITGTLKS